MSRSRRFAALFGVLWLTASGAGVSAHALPPEVVAYFIAEGPRLRVLVRVPTSLLADAGLPVVQPGYLDLANIDAPLKAVAAEVVRSLDLADGGRALPPPASVSWRLAPPQDLSFATAEKATAHLSGPRLSAETPLYWNEAFVDFEIDVRSPDSLVHPTARLNGLGPAGEPGQTRATYVPAGQASRAFLVTGPPRRIEFEPTAVGAAVALARGAVDQLASDRLLLLFLFCSIVVQRARLAGWRALAVAACANVLAMIGVQMLPGSAALPARFAAELGAAVVLVAMAVMNVVGGPSRAFLAAGGLFGTARAVALGIAFDETVSVAGSHAWLGFVAYESTLLLGALLLVAVTYPVVRLVSLIRVPEWAVVAFLSALPAHEASHLALEASSQLTALDLDVSSPALALVVRYWMVLALGLTLAALLGVAARSPRSVVFTGAGPAREP